MKKISGEPNLLGGQLRVLGKDPIIIFQRIYYETMFTLIVFAGLIHLADDWLDTDYFPG